METRIEPAVAAIAVLGVFVALAGLTTIVGMPWQHLAGGTGLAVLRVLGSLLAVGVGAVVVWVALRR